MHISSLPGPFGTGTIGTEARNFARKLVEMGCTYWQILPINHLSEINSPYSNLSLFALNPSFIDLYALVEEGVLSAEEVGDIITVPGHKSHDLRILEKKKLILLRRAFSRADEKTICEVHEFSEKNKAWLDSYAVFVVLKNVYGNLVWNEWPGIGLRLHKTDAVLKAYEEYENDVLFWKYIQYVAYKQWFAFKKDVNEIGIKIIGDLPIYASFDSADVWACNHLFCLNTKHIPKQVAGVPPDYFNRNGQLWGNPLYDWDEMKKDGYTWWMNRIQNALNLFDIVRIDHFRGIYSYWAVPFANKTAKKGEWLKGPGTDFVNVMKERFKDGAMIIEDLGYVDEDVAAFFNETGYPGMRVMQFGFGEEGNALHLTEHYIKNCVAYTGTHDNNSIIGWYEDVSDETARDSINKLFPDAVSMTDIKTLTNKEICHVWIDALFKSAADLAIVPIQDILYQDATSRMNTPGTQEGNWSYRLNAHQISELDIPWIRELNTKYNRI